MFVVVVLIMMVVFMMVDVVTVTHSMQVRLLLLMGCKMQAP